MVYLESLLPKYAGKNIGAKLMNYLLDLAKQQEYHKMIGGIDSQNKGSIRFHQYHGFKQVALLKEVGFKNEQWLDFVMMQRML